MASSEPTTELQTTRTLLFRVGPSVYGCDIEVVREIVPFRRATRLPGAPAYVLGLINLRGTIVTVVDLGRRLAPERPAADGGSIVLVGYGSRVVGMAVEEVMDVRLLAAADAVGGAEGAAAGAGTGSGESRGDNAGTTARPVVRGLGHADDAVVSVLDMHMLIKQVLLS